MLRKRAIPRTRQDEGKSMQEEVGCAATSAGVAKGRPCRSKHFKTPPSRSEFWNWLTQFCAESVDGRTGEGVVEVDEVSFRRGMYRNLIAPYWTQCRAHYHISKRHYLDRALTFSSFITVVRQLCNFLEIPYTYDVAYHQSKHHMVYHLRRRFNHDHDHDNNRTQSSSSGCCLSAATASGL